MNAYDDYRMDQLLETVKPEIRDFHAWLIQREGPDQGRYIFAQVLAELKFHVGLDDLAALMTVEQGGDYNRAAD